MGAVVQGICRRTSVATATPTIREVVALLKDDHAPDLAMAQLLHGRIARDAAKDDEAQANFKGGGESTAFRSGWLVRRGGWPPHLADLRVTAGHSYMHAFVDSTPSMNTVRSWAISNSARSLPATAMSWPR